MGTSSFQQGAIINIDGAPFALLRKISDSIWQLESQRTKRISEYTDAQLLGLYVAGQLTFLNTDGRKVERNKRRVLQASDACMEAAKIRRLYVLAVLSLPNTESAFKPAILQAWNSLKSQQNPPCWTTVFRWKKRYQESGNDIYSLVDDSKGKGNRDPRYPVEVTSIVEKAITERYLQPERQTIQKTLDYATSLVVNENQLRPQCAQLPLPSRRLVTSMIEAISAFERYAARHGRTAAVKKFRSVLAHRTTAAPLERAEIDHTPLDLFVIDDESRLPLGRPYLTVCIDDYTRSVLGIYISFEPPSHFTVSRCLQQTFMPKTQLLEQFPAIQNPWAAHGVMRELVVDNGLEFHSTSFENACYSLGIEIHYSARKTPWFKGKIERFLGTLNRAIAHGTPGTTFRNIFDKEDYDPSKFALVRYSTLKEIVYTWVADVYHQQVHRALGVPPAVVWEKSIRPEDIQVPDDPLQLQFILGRSEERVLSHKGIELYGLQYNSPELTALRRKFGDKLDVSVRVDTSDLGTILVLSPDNSQTFKVPALQWEYANGLSEWQHKVCKRFAAREMDAYGPNDWLKAKERIRELIEREFMHKKQQTRTKMARYKNMDATRQEKPVVPVIPGQMAEIDPVVALPEQSSAPPVGIIPDATPRTRRLKPLHRERIPNVLAEEYPEVT